MTPGWKTTEFWASLAAILIGAIMASGALDHLGQDNTWVRIIGIASSVLAAMGYTAQRGFVKSSNAGAVASIASSNPTQPPQP